MMKARKNPAAPSPCDTSVRLSYAAANKLLKSFAGAGEVKSASIPDLKISGPVVILGPLSGIMYFALRDGVNMEYIHRFAVPARPLLAVTHDGKQLLLLGGAYQVTAKGVEDRA
jgi:hypothetical protein